MTKPINNRLDHTINIAIILTIFQTGKPGEAYNVSTRQCLSKELTQQICKQLDQQHPRLDNKSHTD